MQADAEHQQNDADLGELVGKAGVGDEAWRVRADQHAGYQIAEKRRNAERLANAPKTKASPKPATMVAIRGVSCGIVYGAPFKNRDVGQAPPKAVAFRNMAGSAVVMQPPPL